MAAAAPRITSSDDSVLNQDERTRRAGKEFFSPGTSHTGRQKEDYFLKASQQIFFMSNGSDLGDLPTSRPITGRGVMGML